MKVLLNRHALSLRLALLCCVAVIGPASPTQADIEPLSRWVATSLDAELRTGVTRPGMERLYDQTVRVHGDVLPLLAHMRVQRQRTSSASLRQSLIMAESYVLWRRGDTDRAAELLSEVIDDATRDPDPDLLYWRARLYDGLGRIEDAKAEYERVLTYTDDPVMQRNVRLRVALMGLLGGGDDEAAALSEFAENAGDDDLRNRAAIVLALQNRPADAIALFVPRGEGTRRFRDASRVAEWAIRANDAERATAAALEAVQAAELRRDRRYALTLLVEAHRMADSIDALITSFGERDDMTREEREVWINLLREQQRYDEAIALFQSGSEGAFDIDMRRALLEMEREAGREQQMIETYRGLIESEPDQLTWRFGLTQVLLETGEREQAEALWPSFLEGTVRGATLLESAQGLAGLGLDDLAVQAVDRMLSLQVETGPGLLFLAQIHRDRGRLHDAESTLDRLDALAGAGDSARFALAEAYEQLGRQRKAVEVMEGIRDTRDAVAADLEMRLAWLYSEIGEEDKALALWLDLWRRINSVPRRRYVEDRLMTVASRLGRLADIAIELEEKLLDAAADDREAGLLVRIYTRVNDPVSATEVLNEHMRQSGASELDTLTENARIYLICEDYFNYEKTVHRMIDVDPEGRGEYLRQLAMSQLERGRPDEARDVLTQLRAIEVDDVSREFEAGVLALAGMREEAAEAYRRGIAEHPDRIESYLLLANMMRDLGQTERAVGMFKYLAETAARDDMFTIAIDGLLNMEADRATVQWARRITLERLAGREDKNYLYQLLADLSEEAGDKDGQIRALENSIAIAGTRRLSILRECMDLSSNIRGGMFYAPGRGPTNAGNKPFFAFARRLIGLDEAVPPQVFSDLGKAFLADDQPRLARQTFSLARNLPDERAYRREVAGIFEQAGHREEALGVYERLLRTSPSDVGLITKVAQLHEQNGDDDIAYRFSARAVELLLSQSPLTSLDADDAADEGRFFYWSSNRDAYQTFYDRAMRGLLVTLPDSDAIDALIDAHEQALASDLAELSATRPDGVTELASAPRIQKRALALRRLLIAFDRVAAADVMDLTLLRHFPDDEGLLESLARTRVEWGYYESARRLAEQSGRGEDAERIVRVMLGEEYDDTATSLLEPSEAMGQIVPLLTAGDREAARAVLRRMNTSTLTNAPGGISFVIINGVAQPQGGDDAPALQFLQIAKRLEDHDLVLRLARGWFKATIENMQIAAAVTVVFDQCLDLLEGEHRESFLRHVADLLNDDPNRAATHLALLKRIESELDTSLIDEDVLLTGIEEGKLALGWQFPADSFLAAAPESIRVQAFERILNNTQQGARLQPLLNVVFLSRMQIDGSLGRIIEDYFIADLRHAKEAGRLDYIAGMIPNGPEPLRTLDNAPLALQLMQALDEFIPNKERDAIKARSIIIARQMEDDDWLERTLELYGTPDPPPDGYNARNARMELFRVAMQDHPQAFLDRIDAKEAEHGSSLELTDERIRMANMIGDPEIRRQTIADAAARHPEERRFLNMLENLHRRERRLLQALKVNQSILDMITATADTTGADATIEELIDLMIEHIVQQTSGGIDAAAIRPSIQRMADSMTIEEFRQQMADQGIALPGKAAGGTLAVHRRMATLWSQLDHPLNGLPHWQQVHEQEQAAYHAAVEAEQEDAAAPIQAPAGSVSVVPAAGVVPAVRMRPAATGVAMTASAAMTPARRVGADEEARDDSMVTVRQAVEAGEVDRAREVLRRLWRTYPADDARPFIVYGGGSSMASLMWPRDEEMPETASDDDTDTDAEELTEEEKRERERHLRAVRRGGLDTFRAPEQAVPVERVSAWKQLAGTAFGVDEMQRALRSRTAVEVRGIKPVILGLLEARRLAEGDDAVRTALLDDVRSGTAGQVSLIQLFALLNESPELLGPEDHVLLDDLVRTLEPDESRMLSRIAWLYAHGGAHDRAVNLYAYCAARATDTSVRRFWNPFSTDQSVSLREIVTDVKSVFEGDAAVTALERIFDAADLSTDRNILLAAETWTELLGADEAIARLQRSFDDLDDYSKGIRRGAAMRGAELFARAGDIDNAQRCLRAAAIRVRVSELPPEMRWSYWGRDTIDGTLADNVLFRLFPEDMSTFAAPEQWLSGAGESLLQLINEERAAWSTVFRPLCIIALRLQELESTSLAREILASIRTSMPDDTRRADLLLLLDVLRRCGMTEEAVALAGAMREDEVLPVRRFGDLVRDSHALQGPAAALLLADTLLDQSLDADLFDAAIAIASDTAVDAEPDQYRTRLAEAEAARETIKAWREEISGWKKDLEARKAG